MRRYFLYLVLLLFVFVVMVLLFNSSSCYALSFEDIKYYVDETAITFPNNPYYQGLKRLIDSSGASNYFANQTNNLSNKTYFYLDKEGSATDDYMSLYVYTTPNDIRVNANSINMFGAGGIRYRCNGGYWTIQQQSSQMTISPIQAYKTTTEQYNTLQGMLYTPQPIEDIYTTPATYVGNQGLRRINELSFDNYLINNKISSDNKLIYYYKGDLYSNLSIPIGEIERNDAYHYEVWLENDETHEDIAYTWVDYSTGTEIKRENDKIYISGSNMLVLKTLYLKYNTRYRVTITSYYGDYDNPTIKSIENLFIFLPNGTSISGDQIIGWVSGDNISDDTIQIIGNQDESTNDIISSITNYTPINSGDIINNIDIIPIYSYSSGDSIATFFVDVLQHISDVFLLDDEVTLHLVLPIFSHEINIRSDFWITHDYLPQLADFINGAWWFIICLGMLYKIDVLVELYNFGDFITASYYIYQTRRLL